MIETQSNKSGSLEEGEEEGEEEELTVTNVAEDNCGKRKTIGFDPEDIPTPKRKRGRPKQTEQKLDSLLLLSYKLGVPEPFMKVDKTVVYKKLNFIGSPQAPKNSPSYDILVGGVVCVWNYGSTPVFIKAITHR